MVSIHHKAQKHKKREPKLIRTAVRFTKSSDSHSLWDLRHEYFINILIIVRLAVLVWLQFLHENVRQSIIVFVSLRVKVQTNPCFLLTRYVTVELRAARMKAGHSGLTLSFDPSLLHENQMGCRSKPRKQGVLFFVSHRMWKFYRYYM